MEGPWVVMRICGFTSYFQVRKAITWAISRVIYALCVLLELATYYRFYYLRAGLTCTIECLVLFILCLALDVLIWKAHWCMTYRDPGFVNDVESV